MLAVYKSLYSVFECPNIRHKKPTWLKKPSEMTVFAFLLVTYFLVTGGVIYDVIVEPPSVGSTTDAMGRSKPVIFVLFK